MNDERNPLDGLRPVIPPSELRARVLGSAVEALARGRRPREPWTRLVESRVARLAWAAAVIALVLGHLALSAPGGPISPPLELTPHFADRAEPELIELVTMTAIDAGAGPGRRFSGPRQENGS